jgi:hypothetical protein
MMVKNTMTGGLTPWEIRRAMMGNKGNKGFTSMVGRAADVEVVDYNSKLKIISHKFHY